MADDVQLLLIFDFEGIEHERVIGPSGGEMDIVAYPQLFD